MADEDAKVIHGGDAEVEEEEGKALTQTLLECARQLEALCGQLGVDADSLASRPWGDGDQFEPTGPWERGGSDEEDEDEDVADCSAARMAGECMEMLASMESLSLEERDDDVGGTEREQVERRQTLILLDGDRAHSESTDAHVADQTDSATSVNRELLDEMNALSDELGAFTSLMLETTECSSGCDEETPLIRETHEEVQSHRDLSGATSVELPVRNLQVNTATKAQKPVLEPVLPAQFNQPLSQITRQNPPLQSRAQSNYQKMLRANPPKPTRITRFRGKPKERERPTQQQQHLHSKMREILSSPTLWKEYQSKSFKQHIKRQQQARHLAEQESLEAEQAAAAHFKRAQYALKLKRGCPERRESAGMRSSKAVYDASYLRRFWKDRRGLLPPPQEVQRQHASPLSSLKGLLCGVYVYGKRQLGLAYFTCTSLAQLEERVCLRFGITSILNLYRERVTSTKQLAETRAISGQKQSNRIRTFQRITSFDQVRDGDHICATQDAYEDMAIMCEWIKHRQQQIYHMRPGPLPKPAPVVSTMQTPSANTLKMSQTSTRGPAFTASTHHMEESASLWDANGRCMAVKKQLIV